MGVLFLQGEVVTTCSRVITTAAPCTRPCGPAALHIFAHPANFSCAFFSPRFCVYADALSPIGRLVLHTPPPRLPTKQLLNIHYHILLYILLLPRTGPRQGVTLRLGEAAASGPRSASGVVSVVLPLLLEKGLPSRVGEVQVRENEGREELRAVRVVPQGLPARPPAQSAPRNQLEKSNA